MKNTNTHEYEIISHNNANFKLFLVNLLYRTSHFHKDFEIGLIIHGNIHLATSIDTYALTTGDIFIINSYQKHELKGSEPALVLSLQVPAAFFDTYFPNITHVEFLSETITEEEKLKKKLAKFMKCLAKEYFKKEELYEFRCAILINHIFYELFKKTEYTIHTDSEAKLKRLEGKRASRIANYIDAHYTKKILLSDIAQRENLDLYYLSHLFKNVFGMPFQTYVTKLRCEHARHLLLITDHSLLDISMESGFSDPKYFNKSFKEQYGCTPKQYRKDFEKLELKEQQRNMLSTQEFLSDRASLVLLEL